jgi:hypothetical protein
MGRIVTVSDGAGRSVIVSNWGVAQTSRHRTAIGGISSSQVLLQMDTVTFEAVLEEVELQCTIFLDTYISSCNYPSSMETV